MTTVVLVVIAIIAGAILLAGVVSLAVAYAYEEEPRADEIRKVTTADGWRIRLCRYKATSGQGEPVLVVHGLCANQFNMSLPNGHSLIDYLSRNGFDCWAIDMRGSRSSRGPSGISRYSAKLQDVVNYDLPAAIDCIRSETGAERIHWAGHSLGGLVYYAYEQVHGPDALASVCTIGTPPDLGKVRHPNMGPIRSFIFAGSKYTPGLVEFFYRLSAPMVRPIKHETVLFPINWSNVHPAMDTAGFYNVIEMPTFDYLDTLDGWTRDGTWRIRTLDGREIDVQAGVADLQAPLLSIYGAADPLAPAALGEQFAKALNQRDKAAIILSEANGYSADYNHIDLVFAKNGDAEVFEPIRQWFTAHAATVMPEAATASPAARFLSKSEKTRWGLRLEEAAQLMDEASGGGKSSRRAMVAVAATESTPRRRPRTLAAKKKALKARTEKAKPKKKTVTKKVAAKQKTAVKKKSTAPKKRTTTTTAKKPAAKKKTITKQKPSAKKKTVIKKKPTAKKRTLVKEKAAASKTTAKKKAAKKPAKGKAPAKKKKAAKRK